MLFFMFAMKYDADAVCVHYGDFVWFGKTILMVG